MIVECFGFGYCCLVIGDGVDMGGGWCVVVYQLYYQCVWCWQFQVGFVCVIGVG